VDDIYVDGGKLARNGGKTAICQSQILVYSLFCHERLVNHETSKIGLKSNSASYDGNK